MKSFHTLFNQHNFENICEDMFYEYCKEYAIDGEYEGWIFNEDNGNFIDLLYTDYEECVFNGITVTFNDIEIFADKKGF